MRKDMQKIESIKKKKKVRNICIIAAACVCVAAAVFAVACQSILKSDKDSGGYDVNRPSHYADIEIENYGTITVALYEDAAPITVDNFVSLAKSGFYDGLTFHRIMKGFMMQGGDPKGNGTGGSDKTIKGEFKSNGVDNPISHTRGAISMARQSRPYDSASSQFFIVHEDSTFLDGDYAAFGYVTEGMDVVDKVCEDARPVDDNGTIPAEDQPVIKTIKIRETK